MVQEVLGYRVKAPRIVFSKWFSIAKIALFILSIAVPVVAPTAVSLGLVASLVILLAVLGLRRSAVYTVFTAAILYLIMFSTAFLLHGDLERITRLTLLASSSLSTIILIASTTKPSMLRRWPTLYLFSIVFANTLKEVVDIATVYRARGSGGLRYVLQVVVASMAMSIARTSTLVDSLKARGIEVTE
ncbi:MAG: hypothetical protein QW200_04950, partial [Ignisphaera sp.]